MKKYLYILLLLIFPNSIIAGVGDYEEAVSRYYSLFWQTQITEKSFYTLLNSRDYVYGMPGGEEHESWMISQNGNLKLWQKSLPKFSKKQLADLLLKKDQQLLQKTSSAIQDYLLFAQHCGDIFSKRSYWVSWDYERLLGNDMDENQMRTLVQQANENLNQQLSPLLRMRYYYQIIRLLHYTGNWQEAIDFWEGNRLESTVKNEIYYYIIDQIAGCYYSLGQTDKAAYLFTKVLSHSEDKKMSAKHSLGLCIAKNADGKNQIKTHEDRKDYAFMKEMFKWNPSEITLKPLHHLHKNDPRLEVLFARYIHSKEVHMIQRSNPIQKASKDFIANRRIIQKLATDPQTKNKDFWKVSLSYMQFLEKDPHKALATLEGTKKFGNQKKLFHMLFDLYTWETITTDQENIAYSYLQQIKEEPLPKFILDSFENLILDRIGHLYLKNNQIAKSFLVHNSMKSIGKYKSHALLDTLHQFFQKEDKSALENYLLLQHNNTQAKPIEWILYNKANLYMLEDNLEAASQVFDSISGEYDTLDIPDYIFSSNIVECFNCPAEEVMEDMAYKTHLLSGIIPTQMNKKQLTQVLLTLKKIAKQKDEKGEMANYVLGNYYYNLSKAGYYRAVLLDNSMDNYYRWKYYADSEQEQKFFMEEIENEYSLVYLHHLPSFFDFLQKAQYHFEETIRLSRDREFEARCYFYIAKCELNLAPSQDRMNISYGEYSWQTISLPKNMSFSTIEDRYSDTNFRARIRNHCSYYQLYINN